MQLQKHIPNMLTLANLTCGVLAAIAVLQYSNLPLAALLVLAGAVFDFFDGFAARLLHVSGEMGKQLDSLADMVTFGLVPSVTVYALLTAQTAQYVWLAENSLLTFTPLLIAVFSAYRLAKFNIDTRQTDSFIGLPTPANALFWMAVPMVVFSDPQGNAASFQNAHVLAHPLFLLVGSVVFSFLLIAELPLIAMKFKHFSWVGNEWRFSFIGLAGISLTIAALMFQNVFAGVPVVILLYLIISILSHRKSPRK